MQSRGYTPHIRPRGEEKKELERSPDFHARRRLVEVTHSFFNRFRKLLVRYEKKAASYLALVQRAASLDTTGFSGNRWYTNPTAPNCA